MLNKILIWIAEMALNWAFSRIKKNVTKQIEQNKEDELNEVTDATNVPRYKEAKDRAEKIRAAEALLNSTPP